DHWNKNEDGEGFRHLFEVRVSAASEFVVGASLCSPVEEGDIVDIVGFSKGHGFTGAMRRHNFKGGGRSHGQSGVTRRPLSAGAMGPARVFPGKKTAGRHGHAQITIRNSLVVVVDSEKSLVAVEGGIPGPRGALVRLHPHGKEYSLLEEEIEEIIEETTGEPSEVEKEESSPSLVGGDEDLPEKEGKE
ncbi:50S ribosomal protein L3, partial [bacterium]|nr:50S ribosomal protein L3 [bacterium]